MLVYSGTKDSFMDDMVSHSVPAMIETQLYDAMHIGVSLSEKNAWTNSLNAMYIALNTKRIPDSAGIAIEYNIPMTSKRVDFLVSGYNGNSQPGVVIIELKQWSKLKAVPGTNTLVETFLGGHCRQTVHPSYQAWSYAALVNDYNTNVQDQSIGLFPCAYLHNYLRASDNDPLDSSQYSEYLQDAPAFTSGQISQLRRFITDRVHEGDNSDILHDIECAKLRPSKKLQDCIIQMLEGNPEFVLIDEQRVAYESIMRWSEQCQKDDSKCTIIVEGGPGTGKSVVAVNLLAALTAKEHLVQYVSKATAPRNVYLRKLTGKNKSSISNLFGGSGRFVNSDENAFDTLIVDEAHRLNEKSGLFKNQGENQIKEIIHAARCSVFFLDENQRVTMNDIGSEKEIRKWAEAENSTVHRLTLPSQFRCNGSNGYLAWLDDVLQIRPTANYTLDGSDYDFRVIDSPNELRRLIEEKNSEAELSRMVAGYCWNWKSDEKHNTDWHDIVIDDFEMSWNLNSTTTYAIDVTSIHEVGCIHTVQGLEFAYVGVIIGDDMRFEKGRVVTDFWKRAHTDTSLRGIKTLAKENPEKANEIADEIIKNTYRTLMTRGLKGCYVYCTNRELAEYLKEHMYG